MLPGALAITGVYLFVWSDHDAWPIGSLSKITGIMDAWRVTAVGEMSRSGMGWFRDSLRTSPARLFRITIRSHARISFDTFLKPVLRLAPHSNLRSFHVSNRLTVFGPG